jgi:glycosyltransferase involved in cell wall biosynthesis
VVNGTKISGADIRRRLGYARQVFESIDVFVAPSHSMAEEFCRLGLPSDRVQVSDYGFHAAHSGGRSSSRGRETGDTGNGIAGCEPLRIGFVGTLVWHKGVHILIEAARRLRGEYQVLIHGDTAVFPNYSSDLRKASAGLPVVFREGFDRDRVDDVYEGLDVLVVPSLWPENSPLVIHEAFMHGVPVVAARVGGVPELVRHDVNGFLYEPFDAESLAASLQRVIDDRGLLARLSEKPSPVKSIEQDAREWEERYRRICSTQAAKVEAWA